MKIKRRTFLGFFLIGGIASLISRKFGVKRDEQPKEAMFWRKRA